MACHWASGHQQQQTLLSCRFLKCRGMSGFTANYIPVPPYFAPSRYFSSLFSSLIVALLALLNPIPNAEYDTEFQACSYSYICHLSFSIQSRDTWHGVTYAELCMSVLVNMPCVNKRELGQIYWLSYQMLTLLN